jgi:hypothetical protein
MPMKKSNKITSMILIILVIIFILILYLNTDFFNSSSPETKRLASIQIREYNGSRLSSINDFRENSIKGPQHINISNYHLKILQRENSRG